MRKVIIGIIIAIALVLFVRFVPIIEISHSIDHRHTEIFYEDGEPKERLIIDCKTQYAYVTVFDYLKSR